MTNTFLSTLFAGKPKDQAILIWTKVDKFSRYFKDPHEAQTRSEALAHTSDVYFGVCTASGEFAKVKSNSKKRPTIEEVVGCPALFLDLDYGESHQKKNIPPTEKDAIALVMRMPCPPTYIVNSGNGLHAYWMLSEFYLIKNDEDRKLIDSMSYSWQAKCKKLAADFDWDIDSTFDLARILRVPGTLNRKTSNLKDVTVLQYSEQTYTIKQLQDYLDGVLVSSPSRRVKPASSEDADALILDPKASVNFEKYNELCREEPKFKQSFERTRKNMKDTSPSSYDMSLATYAANAGWTDQEIVNLIIASRKLHNNDLKLREDYYRRTLARARTVTRMEVERVEIEIAANAEVVEDKNENIKNVSIALGIDVSKFIKYTGDKPTYVLYLAGDHEITFVGAEALMNQRLFAKLVMEKLDISIPTFKAKEWDNIKTLLNESIEVIDGGRDSHEIKVFESMLATYLTEQFDIEDDSESHAARFADNRPAKYKENIVFLLQSFMTFAKTRFNETGDRRKYTVFLKQLGSDNLKASVRVRDRKATRVTSKFVWTVPTSVMDIYYDLGGYGQQSEEEAFLDNHIDA